MELVESQSTLKRFYNRYIHEPFLRIKARWLAYFAGFAMDDDPSASDMETEVQRCETIQTQKERSKSIEPRAEDRSRLCMGRFAFISSAWGATFGLGHVWRFPNLAYKYGGGAFLVIYVTFTLLFGYALFFTEVAVGQYSSKGPLRIFERVPLLQGVGYSIVAYGYLLGAYYSQVVAFGIYYFVSCFDPVLPWTICPDFETDSNETMCFIVTHPGHPCYIDMDCNQNFRMTVDLDKLCEDDAYFKEILNKCCDPFDRYTCRVLSRSKLCRRRQFPSSYYWTTHIIRPHSPSDSAKWLNLDAGDLKFLLCTLGAWVLIYVLVSAGLNWTRIVTLTVAPFTLVAFLLMIVVSVGIKGAVNGIVQFFVPNLQDFYKSEIWYAALSHAFFSLGVAVGPNFTLGAFSKFRNPCHIDTLLVTLTVVLTSLLTGTVVFSMVGYITDEYGTQFYFGSTMGSGTSIIAYSDILSKFPMPWLVSTVFFFFFAIVVAVSVSCVIISTSTSIGEVSKLLRKDKYVINFLVVFSSFLLNLPMILREGVIIFSVLDNFTMRVVLPIICVFEILSFFVYGCHVLHEDFTFMLGSYPNRFYKYTMILCPFVVTAAFVYKFTDIETTQWLQWAKLVQLTVAALLLCPIFFFMIGNLVRYAVSRNPKGILRPQTNPAPVREDLQLLRTEFKMPRTIC